jgi:catechol 2,3-dioxygenase-like lactoylglutathione lyase family enzyme
MRPLALRYVRDVAAARRFYEALGLEVDFASRPTRHGTTTWVEMVGGRGALALHGIGPGDDPDDLPPVDLAFEAEEPLEQVVARLAAAGFAAGTAIVDESFGRSFCVRDPEGLLVQVNELDRELQA